MSDDNQYKDLREYLSLRVDDEIYGVDVTTIMEVIRVPEIAPVAGSSKDILGIINLRGKIITILDLRRVFGVHESESTKDTRIVIIQSQDSLVGLLVDSVIEVLKIDKDDIEQAPTVSENNVAQLFDGIYSRDDKFVIIFNALKMIEENHEDT